eukprot:jgi/Chlat1/2400/Chrsp17S02659
MLLRNLRNSTMMQLAASYVVAFRLEPPARPGTAERPPKHTASNAAAQLRNHRAEVRLLKPGLPGFLQTTGSKHAHNRKHTAVQAAVALQAVLTPPDGAKLLQSLSERGLPAQPFSLCAADTSDMPPRHCSAVAEQSVEADATLLKVPEHLCITAADARSHPTIGPVATGRSEIVALALWLLAEAKLGQQSAHHMWLVTTFSSKLNTPLLWTSDEIDELLKGSSLQAEVIARLTSIQAEYADVQQAMLSSSSKDLGSNEFSYERFLGAMCLVLRHAAYLPSADCFALIPLADCFAYSSKSTFTLDYDTASQCVVLQADKDYKPGDRLLISYGPGRPNADLLLTYGFVDSKLKTDYLEYQAGLVKMDALYQVKKQIVEAQGLSTEQVFPLYRDAFPVQLLSYLRLARIQDPAQLALVSFEKDQIISPGNEYEVLMLMLADCNQRLTSYSVSFEENIKLLQNKDISERTRLAALFRSCEQQILMATLDALRTRLAPIRGIPTKGGKMEDPNADLVEIFDKMEQVISAPGRMISGLFKGNKKR